MDDRSDSKPHQEAAAMALRAPDRLKERPVPTRGYASAPPPGVDVHAGEVRVAARSAAALVIAGAVALAATTLPDGDPPGSGWVLVICGAAIAGALVVLGLDVIGALDLPLLAVFDLLSIGLAAILVERTGGTTSSFAALYLFAVVHAAAFQPRPWLILVVVAAVGAFLAPLAYDTVDGNYDEIAIAGIASTIIGATLIHAAVSALRSQRARSMERETDALRLAEQDALTGLGNYRMFSRALEAEGARARRYGDPFSLVVLDLNGFKAINDELGHSVGDHALRVVADGLRSALRAEDVLCRQGGDEFAVIAVRAGPVEGRELAFRLVDAVAQASEERGLPRPVTASAGWATFGRHAQTTEALIVCADAALRRVKRTNGDPQVGDPEEPPPGAGEPEPGEGVTTADLAALTTLSSLARALTVAESAREIAAVTVAHLTGAIDAAEARVLRWDRAGRALEVVGFGGRGDHNGATAPLPDNRGLLSVVVRERRAVIVADGRRETPMRGDDTGSELAVPVMVGDAVWGVLHASSDRNDAYGASDLALVEAMAQQVGRALAGAWVIERLTARAGVAAPWLADAVEAPGSASEKVAELAVRVGRELGLDEDELADLSAGALFHDIGTLAVPLGVLHKPGRLTEHERAVLRDHVVFGERLLGRVPEMRRAARLVRHAHERVDGGGYPDGLAGTEIPLGSRILLACDAYVAMTSARPYRAALDPEQAIAELRRAAGSQLDSDVVEVLLGVLGDGRPTALSA